nr:class I SAM-dependent methyltransferase [uncultured Dethiosulfovibrio sp.]
MSNYYSDKLKANSLVEVYDTELPRVNQYLKSEIGFVRDRISGSHNILEIGCGYGRIMRELSSAAISITGIDLSAESIELGKAYLSNYPNCRLLHMDAKDINLPNDFDGILCLQNGLSAISAGDPFGLMEQCLKLLIPGGKAYFSTYSPNFWDHRVEWFREQSKKGLLGPLDEDLTKNGTIVCTDGFRATTYTEKDLIEMARKTGYSYEVIEVDRSSLFLILGK